MHAQYDLHTDVLRHATLAISKHVALKLNCVIELLVRPDISSTGKSAQTCLAQCFGETCIMEAALAHAHNVVSVSLQLTNVLQGMIAVCTARFYEYYYCRRLSSFYNIIRSTSIAIEVNKRKV